MIEHDPAFRELAEECAQALDAERCTVYVVDANEPVIRSRAALRTDEEIRLRLGEGLAGQAAATGETINVTDAYHDARFDPSVDQRLGFRTTSMLVVPVWGDSSAVIGILQALNKRGGVFERSDQAILEEIARRAAPTIERARAALS